MAIVKTLSKQIKKGENMRFSPLDLMRYFVIAQANCAAALPSGPNIFRRAAYRVMPVVELDATAFS